MTIKRNDSVAEEKRKEVREKTEKAQNSSENFEPPDGGWGWIIVMAAGFSNLFIFPMMLCFGLIFKDRFAELGITSSQTTTIININSAVTSCVGLANGPLFRRFSFRQVGFTGALICATSIVMLSTMKTFTGVLIFFSILYGVGIGITMSSNALALNTYFKKKRRVATGLSWTCTGMGAIVMPQIITLLMPIYGVEGTLLIFGSFTFNAVACALLLQPVSRHAKKKQDINKLNGYNDAELQQLSPNNKCPTEKANQNQKSYLENRLIENVDENTQNSYSALSLAKEKFGSQYLYYDDDEDGASGIDVMGPTSVMMSRANDGWFSRRNTSTASITSKTSRKENFSRICSRRPSVTLSRQSSLNTGPSVRNLNRQDSETESQRRKEVSKIPLIIVNESCEHTEDCEHCNDPDCYKKVKQQLTMPDEVESDELKKVEFIEEAPKKSFLEAVIIFFDMDLLCDPVYVNMMIGITFATFAELNFSLMTPFILGEYGLSKIQVATVMSTLASVDVVTRLLIPFIADFVGWENRTFFLVGICGLATGRIVLAHVGDFGVTLAVSVLIGMGKALRTIFMALVIPSHVPLSRLPGATGLQLLTAGIVALTLGPVVGWIRDSTSNYSTMLHFLNIFTFSTVISWSLEINITKRKSRSVIEKKETLKKLLHI